MYANAYAQKKGKKRNNMYSIMSNLQTNYHLKIISKKWTSIQEANYYSTAPYTGRTFIDPIISYCVITAPSVFGEKRKKPS